MLNPAPSWRLPVCFGMGTEQSIFCWRPADAKSSIACMSTACHCIIGWIMLNSAILRWPLFASIKTASDYWCPVLLQLKGANGQPCYFVEHIGQLFVIIMFPIEYKKNRHYKKMPNRSCSHPKGAKWQALVSERRQMASMCFSTSVKNVRKIRRDSFNDVSLANPGCHRRAQDNSKFQRMHTNKKPNPRPERHNCLRIV